MKRWLAVSTALVFLAGCSGVGGGGNRFLPGPSSADSFSAVPQGATNDSGHGMVRVELTMHIPKRHPRERIAVHPATISSLTKSVSIAVNGGAKQVFNATPSSPGCSIGSTGTTCTFAVAAPGGTDSFVVQTYSATGGTGSVLDRGTATVAIVKGKANSVHIKLGPVVSNTADTGVGSLRYAVGAANPGDTVMFVVGASSKITLASPITINANVSIAGPGVKSSLRTHRHQNGLVSHTTFSGLTISGAGAQQLFIIKSGVTVTISGVILTDGSASVAHQPGGAINNSGNLTLASDAVTGNKSMVTTIVVRPHGKHHSVRPRHVHRDHITHKVLTVAQHALLRPHCVGSDEYGGAVYNNGTLTVTGTTFDSNVVSDVCGDTGYGGAIYNDQYGTIVSSNSIYSNNGGEYGGAIYNYGTYGQISFTGDKFQNNFGCKTLNGCATSGCAVAGSCTSYAFGYGAAIYDDDGPGVTITSSTFSGNVVGGATSGSEGDGGALYLDSGSPIITGSTFSGNLAGGGSDHCSSGYGGAIYEDASAALELDNDTFTSNKAGGDDYGYGGAIYNDANQDQGSGNTFTGNVAFGNGSDCTGSSSAYSYAGAIYADYGIVMSNSTFANNVATGEYYGEGGAIYIDDPSNLSNDKFTGNSAIGTDVADSDGYAYGGAIENDSTLKVSNSTFTSNSSKCIGSWGYECYGGAIYANSDTTSTNNTFASNSSIATYPIDGYVYGAAVFADSGTYSSNHDTYSGNTATATYDIDGGAIYADGALLNVNGSTFTNNTINAPYSYGGAVEAYHASSVISGSTFTGNVAATGTVNQGYGGAIYDDSGLTINGSTFSNNSATSGGGGMYGSGGETINNSTFTGNKVTRALPYYGGGAYYDSSGGTVNNSTFTNNTSADFALYTGGGAIYNDDALTVTGSTFSGNGTTGSYSPSGGGAIFNYDPTTITNSTFTGNTSATNGGAFFNYDSGATYFYSDTLYGNTAASLGGNIENQYAASLYDTIVAGGVAASNPDIDNLAALTSGDYNIIGKGVDNSGGGSFTAQPHDRVGTHSVPVNPLLAALSTNGGPTKTMADSSSSPGYQKIPVVSGSCNNTGVTTDQRGYARGVSFCDIGAFEANATPSVVRVHASKRVHGRRHHPDNHHRSSPPGPHASHRHASKGVTQ